MTGGETKLIITPEAEVTIGDMQTRVRDIAALYGQESPEHVKALLSLVQALTGIMRLGGRISPDGDLALFGASFIAYGVVWHPKYKSSEAGGRLADELLGEWSTHS